MIGLSLGLGGVAGNAPPFASYVVGGMPPVLAAVPGYHVNAVCRGDCPEALEAWPDRRATPFAVLA